jgi:hypothetical protein
MFPGTYPSGGIEGFSNIIAKKDFSQIKIANGGYRIPSELEMLLGARST